MPYHISLTDYIFDTRHQRELKTFFDYYSHLLFVVTWIIYGYTNRIFVEQIRKCIEILQPTPRPEPILDFDCSFTFSSPPLPPKKKKSEASQSDLIVQYDVPRSEVTIATEIQASTSRV